MAFQFADNLPYAGTVAAACVPSSNWCGCAPGAACPAPLPSEPPGCAELRLQQPDWPHGVEVRDKDVLLAEASALHNTGSGALSLGGLFMAAAGVLLASSIFSSPSTSDENGANPRRTAKKRPYPSVGAAVGR